MVMGIGARNLANARGVSEDFGGDQLADEDAEDEDDDRDSVERRLGRRVLHMIRRDYVNDWPVNDTCRR